MPSFYKGGFLFIGSLRSKILGLYSLPHCHDLYDGNQNWAGHIDF
jgi:hypothetical protein